MVDDLTNFEDYDPEYWNTDRERGILTKQDRTYLGGERELEGQTERNTRYRIRQRIRQGILDLGFLSKHFHNGDDWEQVAKDEEVEDARRAALGAIYALYIFGEPDTNEGLITTFENDLEQMLLTEHPWQEGHSTGRSVDVNIEVHDEGKTIKEIEQALRDGSVGFQEATFYARFGDDDELAERAEEIVESYQEEYDI